MNVLRLRKGDSISWPCAAKNPDGSAVDLTGATVEAKLVQLDGAALATLTIIVTNAALGLFTISATAGASAAWPLGNHKLLLRYTIGSSVQTTETPVRIEAGW